MQTNTNNLNKTCTLLQTGGNIQNTILHILYVWVANLCIFFIVLFIYVLMLEIQLRVIKIGRFGIP